MTVQAPEHKASPSRRRRSRRVWWIAAPVAVVAIVAAVGAGGRAYVNALGPLPLAEARQVSKTVVDREGRLLRAYATDEGRWRLPVDAAHDVDPRYLKMLFAFEDSRFRDHHGVDPRAMLRAAWQWAKHGEIVSGGSTITMQLARLMEPRQTRSLSAKLRQMVRAVQLESALTKDEILDLYLQLAPFGGNLEGVRAAALAYFGKEPKRLSLAEAALLVALPQSPEARRPDRAPEAARAARDRVLARVEEAGVISAADAERARRDPVPHGREPMPMLAPHAADQAIIASPNRTTIRLTLDARLQARMERLVRERAQAQGPDVSGALLVVDRESGDVLAHVGSAGFFDARRDGQVDMTRAVRSPGSTLKPFIYGMAFEDGIVHPNSLIDDRPSRFGSYTPENFDMAYQGTVSVRQALQLSLNVPAILLLERVGPARLSARLKQAGGALVLPAGEAPGLAMGLGGIGISLHDLVHLYTGLSRLGEAIALRETIGDIDAARARTRLMDPIAAWHVGDVLLGAPPPDNGIRHRIAFKTGTSYGYRDAWAVGFDGRLVVGAWTGRPDGTPVPGLLGRSSAAPILFDAFARSGELIAPLPRAPRGTLTAPTARLPLPLRRFKPAGEELRLADVSRPRIEFPLDGSRLELAAGDGPGLSKVVLKVSGGQLPLTVLVNGMPAGQMDVRRPQFVAPPGPGFMRLTVMDARGAADTVVVRLQ